MQQIGAWTVGPAWPKQVQAFHVESQPFYHFFHSWRVLSANRRLGVRVSLSSDDSFPSQNVLGHQPGLELGCYRRLGLGIMAMVLALH